MTKRNFGQEGVTTYSPSSREFRARTQDRNLEARTDTEAMEECSLPICSPWSVHLSVLKHIEPQARDGITQSDFGLPTSIIYQEIYHRLTGQSGDGIFSIMVSSTQMTLDFCVRLPIKPATQSGSFKETVSNNY